MSSISSSFKNNTEFSVLQYATIIFGIYFFANVVLYRILAFALSSTDVSLSVFLENLPYADFIWYSLFSSVFVFVLLYKKLKKRELTIQLEKSNIVRVSVFLFVFLVVGIFAITFLSMFIPQQTYQFKLDDYSSRIVTILLTAFLNMVLAFAVYKLFLYFIKSDLVDDNHKQFQGVHLTSIVLMSCSVLLLASFPALIAKKITFLLPGLWMSVLFLVTAYFFLNKTRSSVQPFFIIASAAIVHFIVVNLGNTVFSWVQHMAANYSLFGALTRQEALLVLYYTITPIIVAIGTSFLINIFSRQKISMPAS